MGVVKTLVLSVYYLIYLTLEKWINPLCVVMFLIAGIWGWRNAQKGKKSVVDWKIILSSMISVLYMGITIWTYGGDIKEPGILGRGLQIFYYLGMGLFLFSVGNKAGENLISKKADKKSEVPKQPLAEEKMGTWKKVKGIILFIYVGGMIPLALLSPYIFPKADDFSFGYYAHIAWERTGSLWEVIKAAFVMIEEAWFDWQGTYSSIFFMAIHPAVFEERWYAMVPFLFVGIITIATYFLMKTIFIDWLQADKLLSQVCIWGYLLFVIQCLPDSQSAFIWYNGAVHYIASHCALLCVIAFVMKGTFLKEKWAWIWATLFAIYVGGGNYVTAVGSLLICLTVFFGLTVSKSWKKYKGMVSICAVYIVALAVNLLAPGNFNKKASVEGYNIVTAFVLAFVESLKHMLGEWMHWTTIVFILVMIPVLWRMVSKINYKFKYPWLVVGYSWCYMASLFFAPLYTLSTVEIGRFQNVMFMQWFLLLLFDLGYVFGWLQRKFDLKYVGDLKKFEKRYLAGIGIVAILCLGLSIKAEPQKYTSVYALSTLMDSGLKTYEEEYWQMVKILESEESTVEIKDFSYIPEYLDVPLRHEGLRLFYDKEEVIIK